MEHWPGSKLGKEYVKAVYCHPAYLTHMQSAWVCANHFSRVWLFVTLWTVTHQAPLFKGFSRQQDWSWLPCLPPGDHPNTGTEPACPATPSLQVDSSPVSHNGSPYAEYIMWKAPVGIKISRRNINNLKYADDTTLMVKIKEKLKILLMKVKKEHEKAGLKLNIQKN